MIIKDKLNAIVHLEENYPMSKLTTWQIGGPAKYFCRVASVDQLRNVLSLVREADLKFFILGGGSNVLFSDDGFDGIVLKLDFKQFDFESTMATVSADIILNTLVAKAASLGLAGLTGLTSIPGTVGGAIVGNAGAYGDEIGKLVKKVVYLDQDQVKEMTKSQCHFLYRDSIFKKSNFILLSAELEFTKSTVDDELSQAAKYKATRLEKIPTEPSAGCVFKNVILTDEIVDRVRAKGYDLPTPFVEFKKIPTAWLIDQLDLKGLEIGGAKVSEQHANFLLNTGNAKAVDIIELLSLIKQKVRTEFNIQLVEEIRYIDK